MSEFSAECGQSSGPAGTFDPQVLNAEGSRFLSQPSLNHRIATREGLRQRVGDVLGWKVFLIP